jgi:choline dehydrogenase
MLAEKAADIVLGNTPLAPEHPAVPAGAGGGTAGADASDA